MNTGIKCALFFLTQNNLLLHICKTWKLFIMSNQGELIPAAPAPDHGAPVVASDDSRICTAARLMSRRPADYERAVTMLAEGVPVFTIARFLHVSPNTIYAIRRREGGEVERMKQGAADKFADIADAAAEAAAERLADPDARAKIPFQHLMIGAGVAIDKAQLLSGGATARIEISRDDGSDFERMIAEAEAVEIGLAPYAAGQMAMDQAGQLPAIQAPAGPADPEPDGSNDTPPDSQSSGISGLTQ